MSEEKLIFYEGKIKKYQDEFHRLNQKVSEFNQIQKREKELENQLNWLQWILPIK